MLTSVRSVPEAAVEALTEVIVRIDCESPPQSIIGEVVDHLAACAQWLSANLDHAGYREAGILIDSGIRKALDPICASFVRALKDFVVARTVLACKIDRQSESEIQ